MALRKLQYDGSGPKFFSGVNAPSEYFQQPFFGLTHGALALTTVPDFET